MFTRLAAGLIGGVNGAKGSASGLNNEGSCFMTVFPTSNLASRKFRSNLSSDFISSRTMPFFTSSFITNLIASSSASAKAISLSS